MLLTIDDIERGFRGENGAKPSTLFKNLMADGHAKKDIQFSGLM